MVKKEQYTKKVVEKSENSNPSARAERLKKIRNLANLTREDICNIPGLNVNTFKGWELGRFGGLTKDGAERVLARVAQENVICSLDWILHGVGTAPIVIDNSSTAVVANEQIQKELALFQALFTDILYSEIKEPQTTNHYHHGDVVAGIRLPIESTAGLISQICIVETDKNEIITVKLLQSLANNRFLLSTLSGDAQIEATLISVARIIRHYKLT